MVGDSGAMKTLDRSVAQTLLSLAENEFNVNERLPFSPFHHASRMLREGSVQKIGHWNHVQQGGITVRLILLYFL